MVTPGYLSEIPYFSAGVRASFYDVRKVHNLTAAFYFGDATMKRREFFGATVGALIAAPIIVHLPRVGSRENASILLPAFQVDMLNNTLDKEVDVIFQTMLGDIVHQDIGPYRASLEMVNIHRLPHSARASVRICVPAMSGRHTISGFRCKYLQATFPRTQIVATNGGDVIIEIPLTLS